MNAPKYNKELYDKEHVDPENFKQKDEQFWQKLAQGKAGAYVGWWSHNNRHGTIIVLAF